MNRQTLNKTIFNLFCFYCVYNCATFLTLNVSFIVFTLLDQNVFYSKSETLMNWDYKISKY